MIAKYFILLNLFAITLVGQEELILSMDDVTTFIDYNDFLQSIYGLNDDQSYYRGSYSPTQYKNPYLSSGIGTGVCNYIVIKLENLLQPGVQYEASIHLKVDDTYNLHQFYQNNLGIAFSSSLPNNHFGLWDMTFRPLSRLSTDKVSKVSTKFRVLCKPSYMIIGVFKSEEEEKFDCFACRYNFDLQDLSISISNSMDDEFTYLCNDFDKTASSTVSDEAELIVKEHKVYFSSGEYRIDQNSLIVIDSLVTMWAELSNLILVEAHTDISGTDNVRLGYERQNAVMNYLIHAGIDSDRILIKNYADSFALKKVSSADRRVDITLLTDELNQFYYSRAHDLINAGDYKEAHKLIFHKWIHAVSPIRAIFALFDCWGEGRESYYFKDNLYHAVNSKFYKNDYHRFYLDSLYCEDQKGRSLSVEIGQNHVSTSTYRCLYEQDSIRSSLLDEVAYEVYQRSGFPESQEVGSRASKALPYIIVHSEDLLLQKSFLPKLKVACENEQLEWYYYALLYDKISIQQNGFQKYGTQWQIDEKGKLIGRYPYNESTIDECRKQVGLPPLRT